MKDVILYHSLSVMDCGVYGTIYGFYDAKTGEPIHTDAILHVHKGGDSCLKLFKKAVLRPLLKRSEWKVCEEYSDFADSSLVYHWTYRSEYEPAFEVEDAAFQAFYDFKLECKEKYKTGQLDFIIDIPQPVDDADEEGEDDGDEFEDFKVYQESS